MGKSTGFIEYLREITSEVAPSDRSISNKSRELM